MKNRKKFAALCLCAFAATMSFAGCNLFGDENDDDDDDPIKKQNMLIWSVAPLSPDYKTILSSDPANGQALYTQAILDQYKEIHPEIRVKLSSDGGWGDKLNANMIQAAGGGTLPDVVVGETYVNNWARNDWFEPLDLGEYEDKLMESGKAVGMYDGSWYGAPVWTGAFSLYANKKALRTANIIDAQGAVIDTVVKAAGIDPLKVATWEDLKVVCAQIMANYKAQGDKPQSKYGAMAVSRTTDGAKWRSLAFMAPAGGAYLEDGASALGSDANAKAYTMIRDLAQTSNNNVKSDTLEDNIFKDFLNATSAYLVEGIDAMTQARSRAQADATFQLDDIVTMELPTYKENGKKSNVIVGTAYFSVCKGSKVSAAAQDFIKLMLKPENQILLAVNDLRIPSNSDALAQVTPSMTNYEQIETFLAPFVKEGYTDLQTLPTYTKSTSRAWESYNTAFKGIVNDPQSNVAKILGDLDAALAPFV